MGTAKNAFFVIATIAAIIGVLGVLDLKNAPYSGYFSSPNNQVTRVFPDTPAERAGLEVGDVIQSVGGISVQDTKALARRARPEIGETRTFMVDRDGQETELEVTYSELPTTTRNLGLAGALIGFCFLVFPLLAYTKAPSTATFLLALFGLCFGIAFLPGPYSPSYFLRTLGGALGTSAVVMGFAFLVHFLLSFPQPRDFLSRPAAKKIIYLPAILLALFFLFLTLFQPDATPALNQVVGLLVGLFVVGFFGWAIVAMFQNFSRASAEGRSKHGLGLMLFGALVGLVPVTLSSLIAAISPEVQANLPGVRFYFLTFALIPICFALAARRSAS